MATFPVHDLDSAPPTAQALLETAKKTYGMIPNLLGVMAESPQLLEAYQRVSGLFGKTDLSATEQQIIALSISFENECDYCMAAHSTIAKGSGVDGTIIEHLRNGQPLEDQKLEALRSFAVTMVQKRGWPSAEEQQAFLDAGYQPHHILAVILGITLKTMSNFTNHQSKTPVDRAFAANQWQAPESAN